MLTNLAKLQLRVHNSQDRLQQGFLNDLVGHFALSVVRVRNVQDRRNRQPPQRGRGGQQNRDKDKKAGEKTGAKGGPGGPGGQQGGGNRGEQSGPRTGGAPVAAK